MKRKELKNLAEKIAKAQKQYDECKDTQQRKELEKIIFTLSSRATSLEDIMELDEMIQEILNEQH